jgi:steroid delta-isomerase-like uncharacterized protein
MSEKENLEILDRSVNEFWNTGDLSKLDEIWSADYAGHDASGFLAGDQAQLRQSAQAIFSAFPDLRITIEDSIAKGDKVVKRWVSRFTHQGEFMGIPPSGNAVEITGITIYRFAGGKIVEAWSNSDLMGMMRQLGAIP